MALNLTEAQVVALENCIEETRAAAKREIMSASEAYYAVSGAGWIGGASTAQVNKQSEYEACGRDLDAILDGLREGCRQTRQRVGTQDETAQQTLMAVTPDDGGGSGMHFARL